MPEPAVIPERRPLSTRDTAWAKAVADWLGRLGASPNGISTSGMIAALVAGACLVVTAHVEPIWAAVCFVAAAVLIVLRLLANMFDGMVALSTGKTSFVGELFNEIPDRVSDAAILIGAGYAVGGRIDLGYAAACMALFLAYLRAEGKVAGAHQEYCGPMAKQQRMLVVIVASCLAAILPSAWAQEVEVTTKLGVMSWAMVTILAGGVVTVVRRLAKIVAVLQEVKR